jgi:hypothetical protein
MVRSREPPHPHPSPRARRDAVTARSAILEGLGAFLIARELLALDVLAFVPGTSRTSAMTRAAVLAAVVIARRAATPWLDRDHEIAVGL